VFVSVDHFISEENNFEKKNDHCFRDPEFLKYIILIFGQVKILKCYLFSLYSEIQEEMLG
jgi:hypothetical protein